MVIERLQRQQVDRERRTQVDAAVDVVVERRRTSIRKSAQTMNQAEIGPLFHTALSLPPAITTLDVTAK